MKIVPTSQFRDSNLELGAYGFTCSFMGVEVGFASERSNAD
jgi:hypothetical protein